MLILHAHEPGHVPDDGIVGDMQVAHVAWVNMTVFNYEGELQTNKFNLYAWPIDFELEESVHYMGSTVLNPNTSECLCLEVEIKAPTLGRNLGPGKTVIYPPKNQIMELAREVDGVSISAVSL